MCLASENFTTPNHLFPAVFPKSEPQHGLDKVGPKAARHLTQSLAVTQAEMAALRTCMVFMSLILGTGGAVLRSRGFRISV